MTEIISTTEMRAFAVRGMYEYGECGFRKAGENFDTWFNMVVGKAWAEGRAGTDLFTI